MEMHIKDIDPTKKLKAGFVVKCQGKNLTQVLRETIYKLAEEYDKKNSK